MKNVIGADKVDKGLARLKKILEREMAKAARKNGEQLIQTAKVAHVGDGANRAAIKGTVVDDGYLCDFGPKAKVTEGDRGPRPFVNPALAATRRTRKRRASRASKKAIKEAFSG